MNKLLASAFAPALLLAGAAQAHVNVQPATATVGGGQLLHFVVGHGCNGQPTTALRIELPAGLSRVEPQAKSGWTVDADRAPDGSTTAVTWRGGELAPHQPDEFQIQARLPKQPGPLVFAAVQSCGEVTVRWDQAPTPEGRPDHPAPTLTLLRAGEAAPAATGSKPPTSLPKGVQILNGSLADASGRPLYTFNFDTMVGMSHCVEDCAQMWPPLTAAPGAMPFGDWTLIGREDGLVQWAYRSKPLYTYSKDRPGAPPTGEQSPNWRMAR